jgi:hypothetical protein
VSGQIDFINLVALFLAIWHTVRRLDVAQHDAVAYPHVDAAEFSRWRTAALRAHGIVIWACFGYIAADLAFKLFALPTLAQTNEVATRAVGASLCGILMIGIAVGIYRVRNAERLRRHLGIEAGRAREP